MAHRVTWLSALCTCEQILPRATSLLAHLYTRVLRDNVTLTFNLLTSAVCRDFVCVTKRLLDVSQAKVFRFNVLSLSVTEMRDAQKTAEYIEQTSVVNK